MDSRRKNKGFIPFYKIKYHRSEIDKMDDDLFMDEIKKDIQKIETRLESKLKSDPAARYVGHVLSILEDSRILIAKAFSASYYD